MPTLPGGLPIIPLPMEELNLDHLLHLARLRLAGEEAEAFRRKFEELCRFVEKVRQAEIPAGIEAGYLKDETPLREDRAREFPFPEGYPLDYRVPPFLAGEVAEEGEGG